MKKLKTLFKASPIAVIVVGILVASVVSAALLGIYVTMTGTVEVEQSVVFGNDETSKIYNVDAIAGDTHIQAYNLKNRSEVTAPIKFVTSYIPDGVGIDTSYWSTVELSSKDANWDITSAMKATLTYELIASTFNYEFDATGLIVNEEYSLIYYADKPDRFVNWGGNNPGVLIDTFITDSNGNIATIIGSNNIAMNLPSPNDANIDGENYCTETGDNYELCYGAKVWLVPSSDYAEPALTAWNPTTYLFETDLITYGNDGLLNLGNGRLNFFIKNVFAVSMTPGTYTITTEIQPIP